MLRQLFCYHGRIAAVLLSVVFMNCGEPSTSQEIIVDLSGAKALIMPSSDTTARLDLQAVTTQEEAQGLLRKILEDGTIKPVIYYEKGEGDEKAEVVAPVKPEQVFIATDGKVYILFAKQGVMMGGKRCCLIRGNIKGSFQCVDDPLSPFKNNGTPPAFCQGLNYHRQVDSKGNIYFNLGNITPMYILKLTPEGAIVKVLEPPSYSDQISCYAVAQDGTIYFAGQGGSGIHYFRRKKPDGSVESLKEEVENLSISSKGDFFSVGCGGICRGTGQGSEMVFESISIDPAVQRLSLQKVPDSNFEGLVTATGGSYRDNKCKSTTGPFFEDASGRIYLFSSALKPVLRVFPEKAVRVSNKENEPIHVQIKSNFLYYSGLDGAKKNIFRRIDLNDPKFPETDLLKGQEIEVYKFGVSSSGKIYFGGLKLPDNKYFAGTIDGTTLEMKVVAPETRLSELVVTE